MKLKERLADGRGLATLGLLVGISISVAGNVAHAYVPPDGAAPGFRPSVGIVLSAVIWPVILFLTFDIMLRVKWPAEWYLYGMRYGVLGVVAAVAAVVSYQHLSGLLRHWHETSFAWHFGPLAVDGLLVMSSVALVVDRLTTGTGAVAATVVDARLAPAKKQPVRSTPVTVEPNMSNHVPDPRPPTPITPHVPVTGADDAQPLTPTAKLVYNALPGTVAELSTKTGVKRTTVDYALKKSLVGRVRQDGQVWYGLNGSVR